LELLKDWTKLLRGLGGWLSPVNHKVKEGFARDGVYQADGRSSAGNHPR